MAVMNFGGVDENVVTREEFPLEKAREVLKDEVIAVIGYGVQGPGQSLNLRDNGFNVIVGQRPGKTYDKAVADGWVPGETLFGIEEACERATIIQVLLSDAAQIECWPRIKKYLTPGKALYFSHGFAITYKERTNIIPPADVDVILVAPKGSGTSLRRMFLQGRGLNSSYAIFQDATGRAWDRVIALGNFRIHLAAALFVFWLAGALRVEAAGFGLLSLAAGGVLAAEMLNTAVEAAVDLASPGRHPLAKLAKDVSAGAVLVMALASVGVGFAVLWRRRGCSRSGARCSRTGSRRCCS